MSSEPLLKKPVEKKRSKLWIPVVLAGLVGLSFVRWHTPTRASSDRVIRDLEALQAIAKEHGESRSVVNGHEATVQYVVEQVNKYNQTWRVWTEDVVINVQQDADKPALTLNQVDFKPRLDIASATGSGSSKADGASIVFFDSCQYKTNANNFVAVIDTNRPFTAECSYCDVMAHAISEGAKGVIFINAPAYTQGYPRGLPPSPGRCGRQPKYVPEMKKVGVLSLGDEAALKLYQEYSINPKSTVNFYVNSTYAPFHSHNVLADSLEGDSENVILYGSHLDGVPAGPGINDDGSGAMSTLELARVFAEANIKPRQRVRLAWWTGEEIGLLGSKAYVQNLVDNNPDELARIKLSLDNDMLASPNFIRGIYHGDTVTGPMRKGCIAIQHLFEDYFKSKKLAFDYGEFDGRSDYAPFMDHNIPSGGLFTGADKIKTPSQAELFGGVSGVAQDPCYHQDCDRVEQIRGPGKIVLQENLDALWYSLQIYATGDLQTLLQ
ncbi:hypothetical protein EDD86DRAFT_230560, partial [Gorgonomyces haynaldii]